MRRRYMSVVLGAVFFVAAWGCSGSSDGKETKKPRPAHNGEGYKEGDMGAGAGAGTHVPGGEETGGGQEEKKDDVQIEGLLGTIDEQVVANAFAKKRYQIEQCILGHVRAMTYVTGKMNLHFDVAADGTVTVKVLDNTVGNYKVEECLLKLAKTLHFGKPKGGKAKVDYPLSIPSRGTPHVTWGKGKVKKEVRSKRRAIKKCRKGRRPKKFTLHFYVLPGGRMTSLGVHAKKGVPSGFAACVFNALKGVTFPDTFGKVAKVTYKF